MPRPVFDPLLAPALHFQRLQLAFLDRRQRLQRALAVYGLQPVPLPLDMRRPALRLHELCLARNKRLQPLPVPVTVQLIPDQCDAGDAPEERRQRTEAAQD